MQDLQLIAQGIELLLHLKQLLLDVIFGLKRAVFGPGWIVGSSFRANIHGIALLYDTSAGGHGYLRRRGRKRKDNSVMDRLSSLSRWPEAPEAGLPLRRRIPLRRRL